MISNRLSGLNIVVGVTGSIAAYKAAQLCSLLGKAGASVRVAMTACGARFVAPLTFETLTRHPVYTEIFGDARSWEMDHISWAKWADACVVAPATANIIAKMAAGLADDPVTTFYLSYRGSVFAAPAMNTHMLDHPATQANLAILRGRGVMIIEPESGMLACGDTGAGKLAAPEHIVEFMAWRLENLHDPAQKIGCNGTDEAGTRTISTSSARGSLEGKTVVITSGPTHEYIDPVRYITNPSSGRMGAALALEASSRGAVAHLVSGPVAESALPSGAVIIHRVTTADEMLRQVKQLADAADIFVFAAAVGDFRIAHPPASKMKRTGNSLNLEFAENPDIAQVVSCAKREDQIAIGFAAETEDLEANALAKLERKHLDAIVGNDVSAPGIGFESGDNEVTIYMRDGRRIAVSRRTKELVAAQIIDAILTLMH
ncbi:MAG: bifunctional phosphopantothenoylcysteine decarboxylase/phosphopantothenate synthase [Candidatus Sumerlaeota bacterium]|nr:bifunctional phosphopantothenoylcysteine decarboxylase/phosphopantothenate synthase [Candidatus Sumerlaeota bacterium]